MERKEFIEKDPLTSKVVSFLRNNSKNSYSLEELAEGLFANVTTKQLQMVISLLNREGIVRTSYKNGKSAYQIKP
jgi:hypothetical protein